MNPLAPTLIDGTLMIFAVVALLASIVALISLVMSAPELPGRRLISWALLVLLVPLVGAAAWFISQQRVRAARLERH